MDEVEVSARYLTEADEDRGNIFWFFKDPFWNRKFFPVPLSYSRAINNYYEVVSLTLEKLSLPFFVYWNECFYSSDVENFVGSMQFSIFFFFFFLNIFWKVKIGDIISVLWIFKFLYVEEDKFVE